MKTPKTNTLPKKVRQENYLRGDKRQDHGTRGTVLEADWDLQAQKKRQRRAMDLLERSEAVDAALSHLSPSQLEKAANGILRASGFKINEAYTENDLRDAQDADIREQLEYDTNGLPVVKIEDEDEAYLTGQAQLRAEIQGTLNRGKAVNSDPAYTYDGLVDDSGLADYADGFHITDRP